MRCSRSGEQPVEIISTSEHHWLTPPPLLFPECIVRLWWWMETPPGTIAESRVEGSSQVSKETRWKAILLLSSSSLLSSDWILARRILRRGGQFPHFLNLTRTPAHDTRFLHCLRSPGTATANPSHGYSPLFTACDEKVLSTNDLMCRSCPLSYCMIGLTWVIV